MNLKQLVVYVDSMPECATRIRLAADLAHRHDAHLVGAYVAPTMLGHIPADSFAVGRGLTEMLAHFKALEDQRSATARQQFTDLAKRQGLIAEWRVVPEGACDEEKILSARYADLAIVGQRDEEGQASTWLPLLLSSGGPTLVIPRTWQREILGKRVIVAWNASREARRATLDALPFLKAASAVTILVVDPHKGVTGHGELPGADVAGYLARHGVRTDVEQIRSRDAEAGEIILSRAADLEADLIIMGAYGHSRISEFVLGGATRTVLKRMAVPVLMSN